MSSSCLDGLPTELFLKIHFVHNTFHQNFHLPKTEIQSNCCGNFFFFFIHTKKSKNATRCRSINPRTAAVLCVQYILCMKPTNHCCNRKTRSARNFAPALPATVMAAFLAMLHLCCLLQTATAEIQRSPLTYREVNKAGDRRESAPSKVCKLTFLFHRSHSIAHFHYIVVGLAVPIKIRRAAEDTEKRKRHSGRLRRSSRK